jgi:hypothetical protein
MMHVRRIILLCPALPLADTISAKTIQHRLKPKSDDLDSMGGDRLSDRGDPGGEEIAAQPGQPTVSLYVVFFSLEKPANLSSWTSV